MGNLFSYRAGFENISAFSFSSHKDESEANQVFVKEKEESVKQREQRPGSVWAG